MDNFGNKDKQNKHLPQCLDASSVLYNDHNCNRLTHRGIQKWETVLNVNQTYETYHSFDLSPEDSGFNYHDRDLAEQWSQRDLPQQCMSCAGGIKS